MKRILLSAVLAASFLTAVPASAQGCASCKDNASAAPPAFQQALRHGILALMVPAATGFGLFALWLLRRARAESDSDALPPRV